MTKVRPGMIQLSEREKRAFIFLVGTIWGSAVTGFISWIANR